MAKDRGKSGPPANSEPDTATALKNELRRRGMSGAEIESALRKRKRRKVLEFDVVKSRHLVDLPRATPLRPARAREASVRMSDELCTVDFAADQLKLHPKTVLRHIREGRLRATRLGKAYRIRRSELEAFGGLPGVSHDGAAAQAASLTSILDVPGVDADLAQRWAGAVTGALNARAARAAPLRADVVYDPERAHLKIIVTGAPGDGLNLLTLIRAWLDQIGP